ncbi:MAG: hypothetical protein ABI273_07545 [Lacunisphaera sp.]
MRLKIKWNDDRVRAATTAILLLSRDHLLHGETVDLVQQSLAEYRADPASYKEKKAAWADPQDLGPLTKPRHVAYYKNLLSAVDRVLEKLTGAKRQFNSLLELDNALIAYLKDVS